MLENPRNSHSSHRRCAERWGDAGAAEAMTPFERAASTPRGQLKSPYADFAPVAKEGHKITFRTTAMGATEAEVAGNGCTPHQ